MSAPLLQEQQASLPQPAVVNEALGNLSALERMSDSSERIEAGGYELLANFRHALRCYLAESERVAGDAGLTAQRYQALLAIRTRPANEPISVGELARHLVIRPHSAAELVTRLEGADLVRRAEDALDRRRVLLTLSPEGERRLAHIVELQLRELTTHRQTFSRILDLLPAA